MDNRIEERKSTQDPFSRCTAFTSPCGVVELVIVAGGFVSLLVKETGDNVLAVIGGRQKLQDARKRYSGGVRSGEQAEDHLPKRKGRMRVFGVHPRLRWLIYRVVETRFTPLQDHAGSSNTRSRQLKWKQVAGSRLARYRKNEVVVTRQYWIVQYRIDSNLT